VTEAEGQGPAVWDQGSGPGKGCAFGQWDNVGLFGAARQDPARGRDFSASRMCCGWTGAI